MEQQDTASKKDEPVLWNELPSDAVSLIASKYTSDAAEYVSLRLVSRHWRRSLTEASPNPRLPSPQLPFLLVPPRLIYYPCKAMHRLGKVFRVPFHNPGHVGPLIINDLPQLKNTEGSICVGSSHGWLITLDQDSTVSLLNPVTADKICLNTLSTIDDARLSFHRDSYPEYHLKGKGPRLQTRFTIVRRAILSFDPAEDSDFILLLFLTGLTDRCFTLRGKHRKWSSHKHLRFLTEDVIFINGVCIAIEKSANQSVNLFFFDFKSNKPEPDIKRFHVSLSVPPVTLFLVNSNDRLLIISSYRNDAWTHLPLVLHPIQYINIREYPFNGEPRLEEWEKKEFTDVVLFLGHGCSLSVPVQHHPHLIEQVYSTKVNRISRKSDALCLHTGVVYQTYIGDSRGREKKEYDVESSHRNNHWIAPRPFWVTPNLNRYSETKSLSDSFDKSVKVV